MMTDEQKYSALLKELGELLLSKNAKIACSDLIIKDLQKKLEEAEAELDFAKEKLADANIAIEILREDLAKLKGGAV